MAQPESQVNDIEQSIREEVREWSKVVLESSRLDMDGLSICPYAKAAWDANKVLMTFKRTESYCPVYDSIDGYNDDFDINIIIDLDYEESAEEFHGRVESLNYAIAEGAFGDTDLWLMGFHPDDIEEDEPEECIEFEQTNDCSYGMMYLQRLNTLQKAVYKLKNTKYYSFVFQDEEPPHVFSLREKFYKQLIGEVHA